jgi:hypothetical protein
MYVYKGLHSDDLRNGHTNGAQRPAVNRTDGRVAERRTVTPTSAGTNGTCADPTGLTSKNMTGRFVAMRGVLGTHDFNEVLDRQGVRDVAQISSLEKAREVYRVLLNTFRARFRGAMAQLGRDEYTRILADLRFSPKARLSPEQSIRVFQFMQETLNGKP